MQIQMYPWKEDFFCQKQILKKKNQIIWFFSQVKKYKNAKMFLLIFIWFYVFFEKKAICMYTMQTDFQDNLLWNNWENSNNTNAIFFYIHSAYIFSLKLMSVFH